VVVAEPVQLIMELQGLDTTHLLTRQVVLTRPSVLLQLCFLAVALLAIRVVGLEEVWVCLEVEEALPVNRLQ
jgi:hypothetical protein